MVEKAESLSPEDDRYDHVYCVFDRDSHGEGRVDKFRKAIDRAIKLKFYPIFSIECFEVWLLMYFISYNKFSSTSQVEDECKKHFKKQKVTYRKGFKDIKEDKIAFLFERDRIEAAIKNARKQLDLQNENPSTQVGELVQKLLDIQN